MSYTTLVSLLLQKGYELRQVLEKLKDRVQGFDNIELRTDENAMSVRVHHRQCLMAELSLSLTSNMSCYTGPHSFHLGLHGLEEIFRIVDALNPESLLLIQILRDQNMNHFLKMGKEYFDCSNIGRFDDTMLPMQLVGVGYEFGHQSATHVKRLYDANVEIPTKEPSESLKQFRNKNDDAVQKEKDDEDDGVGDDNGEDDEKWLMMDIDKERVRLRMGNKQPIIIEGGDHRNMTINVSESIRDRNKLYKAAFSPPIIEEWLDMAEYFGAEFVTICVDSSKTLMLTFDIYEIYEVCFYGVGVH